MRRILFWLLGTVSAVVLMFGYHTSTSGPLGVVSGSPAATSPSVTSGPRTSPDSPTMGAAGGGAAGGRGGGSVSSGSPRRTTVTGAVASTQWGPVQVQLTLVGGRISGVTVLQQPSGNSQDAEINGYALPILIKETKSAQSATIDMVSGATVTSTGYLQSLQSALDKVKP